MKRKVAYLSILALLVLTSCQKDSNHEYDEKDQDYDQLELDYGQLETDYNSLRIEYDSLESSINLIEAENIDLQDELESKQKEINSYEKLIELMNQDYLNLSYVGFDEMNLLRTNYGQSEQYSIINNYTNIFDIQTLQINDMINGFKVKDVTISEDGYESVGFEGCFILSGLFCRDISGMSWFTCNNNQISRTLPISTTTLDYYESDKESTSLFYIRNEDIILNETNNEMPCAYKVCAIFNNYTYNFLSESCTTSSMEILELLTIEKVE